jgi:hypothetical protein
MLTTARVPRTGVESSGNERNPERVRVGQQHTRRTADGGGNKRQARRKVVKCGSNESEQ